MTVTEPGRRERKKDETRRRIFEVAIALFREKGFEATTVDEITERADVARGTFFNYFPRKESVFSYIAEQQTAAIEEMRPQLLASDASTFDIMMRMLRTAAEGYMHDREVSRLVLGEWIKRDVAPSPEVLARSRAFSEALIVRARERGELRADVDGDRLVAIVKGIFLVTIFQWLYGGDDACDPAVSDLHAEMEARVRLAFGGLSPCREVQP